MKNMKMIILTAALLLSVASAEALAKTAEVFYRTAKIEGLDVFYREAGIENKNTIVLLHGFPTSSHMFRNLIPKLAGKYHVIAPDYPGYGQSSKPAAIDYKYTFDNLALVIEALLNQKNIHKYSLYLQDYGAPVGFRIASKNPKKVQTLTVQNGNAYDEGLGEFWNVARAFWVDRSDKTSAPIAKFVSPEGVKWQYTHGTKNPEKISPDNWVSDLTHLSLPGNAHIQLDLFYDYKNNPPLYPAWQEYFRKYQPPTLIVWGKNDDIFPASGAHPYKRDLKVIDFNLLDTGHFALEEEGEVIANKMLTFLEKHVK